MEHQDGPTSDGSKRAAVSETENARYIKYPNTHSLERVSSAVLGYRYILVFTNTACHLQEGPGRSDTRLVYDVELCSPGLSFEAPTRSENLMPCCDESV